MGCEGLVEALAALLSSSTATLKSVDSSLVPLRMA
jgi:hypothetical protein